MNTKQSGKAPYGRSAPTRIRQDGQASVYVGFWVPAELRRWYEQHAANQDRSLSAQIVRVLRHHMEEQELKNETPRSDKIDPP